MQKQFCDVCRNEIPHGSGRVLTNWPLLQGDEAFHRLGDTEEKHDLCNACWEAVKAFILERKRQS